MSWNKAYFFNDLMILLSCFFTKEKKEQERERTTKNAIGVKKNTLILNKY